MLQEALDLSLISGPTGQQLQQSLQQCLSTLPACQRHYVYNMVLINQLPSLLSSGSPGV